MQFHQVEVDQEVFEYIQKHAVPLVDNFNTALKKLLHISKANTQIHTSEIKEKSAQYHTREIPAGTPQALVQILKVSLLVLRGTSRHEATRKIANEHNVTPQTVIDKYTRQLKITASGFDWLLDQPDRIELKQLLKYTFPNFKHVVDDILS